MKKRLLCASLVVTFAAAAAFAAAPVVFFSDLTSGPATGGQDDKGVFVTIVGKNFGSSRGASSVSIGGGKADNYPSWSDTKITFQLGSQARSGAITVTTSGGTSNGVNFKVRPGRIFFVSANSPNSPGSGTFADPWRSPRSFFTAQQPGDTCYFRTGTYSGQYGNSGRPYNVSFYNSGIPNGSPDNEIAWVGYPGETAQFRADSGSVTNGAFELNGNNQYFIIAGLSIYGRGDGREQVRLYSDNCKLVNNKIEGIKTLSYGMIGVIASNIKIWGNEMFGATSRNKLDHVIYFQSGRSMDNVDIGWNYVHDNDIAVGPMFSWNLGGSSVTNIVIHDNLLDCRNSSEQLRLAGIWSGSGGDVTFANNVIIGAGGSLNNDNAYNAIYDAFAHLKVYNNTFYLSKGAGSNYVINLYDSATGDIRNNIFYNSSNISYVKGNATVSNNLYYGGAGSPPSSDANKITADPKFVNPTALDFHLQAGSPAIDKGCDTAAVAPKDLDGIYRSAGAIDVGAYEYYTGQPVPGGGQQPANAAINGAIRDSGGAGLAGVTVTLSGGISRTVTTSADGSFRFADVPVNAAYSITPEKTGWVFRPGIFAINPLAGDYTAPDFKALRIFDIQGRVLDTLGNPIAGATIDLSGGSPMRTVSLNDGRYVFTGLVESSSYTVKVSKNGYYFTPQALSVPALAGSLGALNFNGTNVTTILTAGQVRVVGSAAGRGTVNPDKGEIPRIYFKGNGVGRYECRVFTLSGDLVWEDSMSNVQDGTFEWIPKNTASGIYTVQVKGPGVDQKKKIAIVR